MAGNAALALLAVLLLLACAAPSVLADGRLDRHRALQRASGLLPSEERHNLKYNPTAGTLPAFPNETAGIFFSGVFTDHVVLQREPAKAAVYGVIFGVSSHEQWGGLGCLRCLGIC